jgi:hypothetical protein
MSTAIVVPPPNSSSLLRRVPRLTARARSLLTAVNLHFAGVAALLILNLGLIAHLVLVWRSLGAVDANAYDQQRVRLRAAELSAQPLRGLDTKLGASTGEADTFYARRLPSAYSEVLAELGTLTKHAGVHLTHVNYAYGPVLSGSAGLTEVLMDASVSGDYRPSVEFINAIERDRMFFVIRGINLTGQQSGQVNLRIRLTTYLRAPGGDEGIAALPARVAPNAADEGTGAATARGTR